MRSQPRVHKSSWRGDRKSGLAEASSGGLRGCGNCRFEVRSAEKTQAMQAAPLHPAEQSRGVDSDEFELDFTLKVTTYGTLDNTQSNISLHHQQKRAFANKIRKLANDH